MSWTLDLGVRPPLKSKAKSKIAIRLDQEYQMKTIVVNIQGPEHPNTTYMTLENLHSIAKRSKKTLLKKSNIIVPAEKMTQLIKAYPKEIGYRKCHTHLSPKITKATLEDYRRFINLNIKKNQLKVHIGNTEEEINLIENRAKMIIDQVKQEGYEITSAHIAPTQGASMKLTL